MTEFQFFNEEKKQLQKSVSITSLDKAFQQQQLLELHSENQQCRQKISNLREQLQFAEEENDKLIKDNSIKSGEIERLVLASASQLADSEQCKEENEQLRQELESCKVRVKQLLSETSSLKRLVSESQANLERAQTELVEKCKQLETCGASLNELNELKEEIQISNEKLKIELAKVVLEKDRFEHVNMKCNRLNNGNSYDW